MGVCCGREPTDYEIDKCKSIDDIISTLNTKKEELKEESLDISLYLEDPTYVVKSIETNNIDKRLFPLRIEHLKNLENAYSEIIEILNNSKTLPFLTVKNHINRIVLLYLYTYDPNKELDIAMDEFKEFVNYFKEN